MRIYIYMPGWQGKYRIELSKEGNLVSSDSLFEHCTWPSSELWRFFLQSRIASALPLASFKHWIPCLEETQASFVQLTALSPAPSTGQCHLLPMQSLNRWQILKTMWQACFYLKFNLKFNHFQMPFGLYPRSLDSRASCEGLFCKPGLHLCQPQRPESSICICTICATTAY